MPKKSGENTNRLPKGMGSPKNARRLGGRRWVFFGAGPQIMHMLNPARAEEAAAGESRSIIWGGGTGGIRTHGVTVLQTAVLSHFTTVP